MNNKLKKKDVLNLFEANTNYRNSSRDTEVACERANKYPSIIILELEEGVNFAKEKAARFLWRPYSFQ